MVAKVRAILLAILIFSCLKPTSRAEHNDAGFIYVTYLNGLPTNNVYDIATDKNGCVWIGTHTGLSKYDGYNVVNYFKEDMNIRSNIIRYLVCDSKNRIWIGSGNGIGLYDNESGKFLTLDILVGEQLDTKVVGLLDDGSGTIWASFRDGHLVAINQETFKIREYYKDRNTSNYFARIWFEPERNLYLSALFNGGLVYLDPEQGTITPFMDQSGKLPFEGKVIKGITKVSENDICITSEDGGIWLIDPFKMTCEQLPLEIPDNTISIKKTLMVDESKLALTHNKGLIIYDLNEKEVTDRHVTDVFANQEVRCVRGTSKNGLIIGMLKEGVAIQQKSGFEFTSVTTDSNRISLKGSDVTGFAQSDDSTIWITTRHKGLFRYDLEGSRLERRNLNPISKSLEGIVYYRHDLWMLSPDGIYRYNPEKRAIRAYREGVGKHSEIVASGNERLLVESEGRLLQYDDDSDSFIPANDFKDMKILGTGVSHTNELVVMTEQKGIIRWDGYEVIVSTSHKNSIPHVHPWSGVLYEDDRSRIWTAYPESGIVVSSENGFNQITTSSGLLSDVVTNIINDDNGNIFITTDRSLSMISPSGKIYTATKSNGLLNYGFTRKSAFKTRTGEILIGSRDGVTVITTEKDEHEESSGTVRTAGKIICEGVEIPLNSRRKAVLKHTQKSFSISTSEIAPSNTLSGRSLYCLEGHDHTWTPAGSNRKLSYHNLKPGKYIFRAYNEEIEPITIRILSHPLLSITAYIIYIIILLALMTFIIIYIRNNEIRKRKEKILEMKLDLHQERMKFFTNIAHEIKTPLTLITTPLTNLKNNQSLDEEARYDISIMDKHSSYLSSLVREVMDMVRIENKNFNIHCSPTNINSKINNTVTNFTEQNTALRWDISIPDIPVWVMADTPATTKILNNLLFNAIKYAESFINVSLTQTEDGFAFIKIANDGEVIPADMREKIFESYVQYSTDRNSKGVGEGFGLGLSVAKNLAERQGGKLYMGESLEINEFIFTLPVTDAPASQTERVERVEDQENTILIVEDHHDLREYISKTLSGKYNILTAENGTDALKIIEKQSKIDLVITDLKMPQLSGMERCRIIKENPAHSHILVIILSANLTPENKVEFMKIGADALIEKPFSMDFLLSRADNLILSRKRLIEQLSESNSDINDQEDTIDLTGLSHRDIQFLQELNKTIEENYTDPEFDIDELASHLNISRSSLNRKMRDILNTSANNYIRDRQLQKAEELLRTSSLQVNEICYRVGFVTPSYFIRCFKKKYGKSPNEYANSN